MSDTGQSTLPDVGARPANVELRGTFEFRAQRAEGKYAVDTTNHRMWFRASTVGEKPDGKSILPEAWAKDIQEWIDNNPVFLAMHDWRGWSIGHGTDYSIDKKGLLIQIEFAVGRNPEADMAWALYQARDMNAVSVGWEMLEYRVEEQGAGRARHEVVIVTRAKLLELSAVPLPLDETALALRMKELAEHDEHLAAACRSFSCRECKRAAAVTEAALLTELTDGDSEATGSEAGETAPCGLEGELATIKLQLVMLTAAVTGLAFRLEPAQREAGSEESASWAYVRRMAKAVTLRPDEVQARLKRIRTEE
jgi:HK97 family phage prohead protease